MNNDHMLLIKEKIKEHAASRDALFLKLFPHRTTSAPEDNAETFAAFSEANEQAIEDAALAAPEETMAKKKTLADILAAKRAAKQKAEEDELAPAPYSLSNEIDAAAIASIPAEEAAETVEKKFNAVGESFALDIVLNEQQLAAKEMGMLGKSFCLIGPAGTGKTTTQREVAKSLLAQNNLSGSTYKSYNSTTGARQYVQAPSIAFCAYTRRAAANLQKAIWKDPELEKALPANIMTIHSLLEYEPETYWDSIEMKEKFRFAPQRHANNPLDITHLVIEEASMLGLDLWEKLYDAMPPGIQIIFIGDINQLPPVFGPSILNYALVQLPIVELVQVYRNQGIVLENAHNILAGRPLVEDSNYKLVQGKNKVQVGQTKMASVLAHMFKQMSEMEGDDGFPEYDPESCIILSPFNKQDLGTDNMNKWIAQFIGEKRNAIVHEVIAGFSKLYLAEGDKVMFNKRDGVISKIERNMSYHGKEPQLPGTDLSRFGMRKIGEGSGVDLDEPGLDYSNFSLSELEEEKAERKMQASHKITIDMGEGRTEELSAAGDFQPAVFSLGYCLTVHKSQGSEWRKVFIILHKDHSVMLFRELFYTAATRARTKVTIFAKDFVVNKAIENQRIKGDTLKDKIAFFNSGINDAIDVQCTKG
ncbi:MAG: ATP-dependent RecD-like DNA helicase [Candidatus Babeliales bacterium]